MSLKVYKLPTLKVIFFSGSVKHCSISVVNSYQCFCKQCYAIAVYATCYIVIYPRGYWAS